MKEVLLVILLCGIVYAAWSLWQENRLGTSAPKSDRQLYRKLLRQAKYDHALVERLLAHERTQNPGKPEAWYLDKVLYELVRDQ